MKKKILFFICIALSCSYAQSGDAENDASARSALVSAFIERIKTNARESLAEHVNYPLRRPTPAPDIRNKDEFLAYYDKLFDGDFRSEIINSDPNQDWSSMGWRGIVYNGIWLDYDGKLLNIYHETSQEQEYIERLQNIDRVNLYSSLRDYTYNIYLLKTDKFIIRLDRVGGKNSRYAAWNIGKTMLDKPDLILSNGEYARDGSGGNNHYKFKNGDYVYEVSENIVGTDETPPYDLKIYKRQKEILYLPATKMFPYQ